MKNQVCVSREMADKLRDAGYPQPKNGMFYAGVAGYDSGNVVLEYFHNKPQPQFDPIYAPTAMELLANLSQGWALEVRGDNFRIAKKNQRSFYHKNPHNCAALAWLHENKKEVQP